MAGTVLTVAWLAGTFLGFRLLRRAQTMGGSCPVILGGSRWRPLLRRRASTSTTLRSPSGENATSRTETFAAALTCIDGRTHGPIVSWIREHSGVDHVDLITQPGMDAVLGTCPEAQCAELRSRLGVSIDAHGSQVVAVVGHDGCAANRVPPDQHRVQVREAVQKVAEWVSGTTGQETEVVGLWVDEKGQVERIA